MEQFSLTFKSQFYAKFILCICIYEIFIRNLRNSDYLQSSQSFYLEIFNIFEMLQDENKMETAEEIVSSESHLR